MRKKDSRKKYKGVIISLRRELPSDFFAAKQLQPGDPIFQLISILVTVEEHTV